MACVRFTNQIHGQRNRLEADHRHEVRQLAVVPAMKPSTPLTILPTTNSNGVVLPVSFGPRLSHQISKQRHEQHHELQDEEDIEDVKRSFPWELRIADELKIIEPPTERELWALKLMDPLGQYTIASIMDRPIGKIIMEGKFNLEGYDTFLGLGEKAIQEVLDFVT